jgi:demethylmenaquinone methyltransferase/2-methoxy-6-polyprenyl-1,4-benzoquinol methylase
MFARIAPTYDRLNRLLSLGIDQRWRQSAVSRLGPVAGARVLDVCTGTGDLAFALAQGGARVLGLDFTPELLSRAEAKRARCDPNARTDFGLADALRLPLRDQTCSGATVAFGLRNVADRGACLREMGRVVQPGGKVLVLEFQVPRGLLGKLYRLYFERVLPALGRLFSRDASAYTYLRDSVLAWPSAEALAAEMVGLGFEHCGFERRTIGIVALHWGSVPAGGLRSGRGSHADRTAAGEPLSETRAAAGVQTRAP